MSLENGNQGPKSIAVIGAGILGASIAFRLSSHLGKQGSPLAKLTLIDGRTAALDEAKGDSDMDYATGDTPTAASLAWANGSRKKPASYLQLNWLSMNEWPRFIEELGCSPESVDFVSGGSLTFAEQEKQAAAARLRKEYEDSRQTGYHTRWIETADQILAMEPALSLHTKKSTFVGKHNPDESAVNSFKVARHCVSVARRQGAKLELGSTAVGFSFSEAPKGAIRLKGVLVVDNAKTSQNCECSVPKLRFGGEAPSYAGQPRELRKTGDSLSAFVDGICTHCQSSARLVECNQVMLAAGTGNQALLDALGTDLPLKRSPGCVLTTPPQMDKLISNAVALYKFSELEGGKERQDFIRQYRSSGVVKIGWANHTDDNSSENAKRLLNIWGEHFPALKQIPFADINISPVVWRPMAKDGVPVIGSTPVNLTATSSASFPDAENKEKEKRAAGATLYCSNPPYVLITHSGVTLAPLLSRLIADELLNPDLDVDVLQPYRMSRFAKEGLEIKSNKLKSNDCVPA